MTYSVTEEKATLGEIAKVRYVPRNSYLSRMLRGWRSELVVVDSKDLSPVADQIRQGKDRVSKGFTKATIELGAMGRVIAVINGREELSLGQNVVYVQYGNVSTVYYSPERNLTVNDLNHFSPEM